MVVGLEGNPVTLDPRLAQDAYSTRILPLVFEGLVILDRNSEPRPCLAESWEMPDSLTWVFHLKKGRKCPDGNEINSRDVLYTFESLSDPDLRSPRKVILDRIEYMEAPDDYTVVFRLKGPYAPFLIDMVMGIVPEDADESEEFASRPYGSGPYMVQNFEPGEAVELIKNPHYGGQPPNMKSIEFRVLPDNVTRVMALEKGDIHLIQNSVPPDDVPLLEKNEKISVIMEPGINYTYLGFNLTDPILDDRRVRAAIAHAIDREKLAECLLKGTVTPASSLLAPTHWAYTPDVETYPYDPELARKLLDESGFPDPEGPDPRFSLVFKTSQNKSRRWVAEAIADQLGKAGIDVSVRSSEWGSFFADVREGNFQVYSLTWVGTTDPDIYYWAMNSESLPPAGANRNRYVSEEMDELTQKGRAAPDRETRVAIYARVQELAAIDLPYISLWHSNNIVAIDRRLSGFEIYPGGDYRSLARARWE